MAQFFDMRAASNAFRVDQQLIRMV